MTKKIITRNENAPFYFEILLAGIEFLDLLEKGSTVAKIQVKPDRKYGPNRRIEDITKFHKDGRVEIIQIKYTDSGRQLGSSELWTAKTVRSTTTTNQSRRTEGTNIFKFLKSWRIHKARSKFILLTILSNRKPTKKLEVFLRDIGKLRSKKLKWKTFCRRYVDEIQNIKSNCSQKPFVNQNELKNFVSSFYFHKVLDISDVGEKLITKLRVQGVVDDDGINAFINRIHKNFISTEVEVTSSTVIGLINRLKTGLIQEIATPTNYIERLNLENRILRAIESKKKEGGFVLLFAPSGSGKTILLSKLAEKNPDFFPYFCRIRPFETVRGKSGYSNKDRLKSSWFKADIIQRCHEFGLLPMSVGIKDDENFIDKTFDEALKILSQEALKRLGKKIVIIVDALDQVETEKHKGRSILEAIPTVNYPGVVFLLSTWGEKYLPQSIKNLPQNTNERVSVDLYFTEDEIKKYFKQVNIPFTYDQVAIIKKKTNGLAISLFYLSKKLKNQNNLDDIINSSPRYTEVFDWYKPIWSSLNTIEKDCLGYLCFHFAKVKQQDFQHIAHKKLSAAGYNELLIMIEHFLDTTGGFIEPYHDSFRRFIVTQLSKVKMFYHQRLATYYSKNNVRSLYGKKYVTKHLEAIGLKDPSVRTIFKKLHQTAFFGKILRSNLDDPTKVEIGKSFVNYFYFTKNTEQLIKYAILTSNIYPTIRDEDVFKKAQIGTEKLAAEVEDELLLPRGNHLWHQREWVFTRLKIGNILKEKPNKDCLSLASRFIDDSLFRISLNPELLWGEEAKHDFWDNIEELTRALVNANQYKRALAFLRKGITFQNPISSLVGFRSIKLAKVHLQNLQINKKESLKTLFRASKMERLVTYLEINKDGLKIPDRHNFKQLLSDETIERFLYDDKYESQRLDLADVLFIHGIRNGKKRIQRLLNKVEIELPYWSHGGTYWGYPGNPRMLFLRWAALKSLIDRNFNLRDFYTKSLKEKFSKISDLSEYENPEFLNILSVECDLAKNRLLLQKRKITWKEFWGLFEDSLKLYKQKMDQIGSGENHSEVRRKLYPYSQDLSDLIRDNLRIVDSQFPNKALFALNKIENIFGGAYINERADLLEILIGVSTPKTSLVKEKLEVYMRRALEIRKKEKLDNLNKSSNLQDLAILAAHKGFAEIADDIFAQSLKYSRGLWSKDDLRFSNLVDCLRTQKQEQFRLVLKYIERVSGVVEGTWYWKLDFLRSAAYADYQMALAYLYQFVVKGEVNHNEALRIVITTYAQYYPYHTIGEVLPLLKLMYFKEEDSYEVFGNIAKTYSIIWNWFLVNKDYQEAEDLMRQYVAHLKRDIDPANRINLLRDLTLSIKSHPQLKKIRRNVESYLSTLQQEGYSAATRTDSGFQVTYDGLNIKKLKTAAKKGHIKAVLKGLDEYTKKKNYFTERLVAELILFLSSSDLQRIRQWAIENKVNLDGAELFSALIKKAIITNNQSLLSRTCSEIFRFINTSERSYEIPEIIKALEKIDFPSKRAVIRKLLLAGIRRHAGSGYYLAQLFIYSSDSIDKHFIDLKKFSFEIWKSVVEKSMRLSLSK
jgi:energy-coupling factor transporter ATP-binding protein EcfA2